MHGPDHYLVGENPDHDRRHPAQHVRTEAQERWDPPRPLEQEKSRQQAGRRSHDQGQADDPRAASDGSRDAAPRYERGSYRVDQEPEGQGRGATSDRIGNQRYEGGRSGTEADKADHLRRHPEKPAAAQCVMRPGERFGRRMQARPAGAPVGGSPRASFADAERRTRQDDRHRRTVAWLSRWGRRRRRRDVAPGARRPAGSAQGLAAYVDDHSQGEKHRTEGNNRARPEPWLCFCELVHNRGAKCGARSDQRMRPRRFVADHQRDGDRLAQGPADSERYCGRYTGASCRPHDFADDLPARGT